METVPPGPARREAAAALLSDTALTSAAISARTGVPVTTVRRWRKAGAPRRGWAERLDPAEWPPRRREAVGRLYRLRQVDPGDLAEALGAAAWTAPGLFKACGFASASRRAEAMRGSRDEDEQPALDGPRLRLALRDHLARAIARCDAALRAPAGKADSARMLRDLTGLKRLLDEVEAGTRPGGADAASEPAPAAAPDLPALRAGIARRYAAFAGKRPAAGLPGEPAAGTDPGPRR